MAAPRGGMQSKQMQKEVKLQPYISSPGEIADRYYPKPSKELDPFFSKLGFQQRWEKVKKWFVSAASYAAIRKKLKSFNPTVFASTTAQDVFTKMNVAFAEGDKTSLRAQVTEDMYSKFKKLLKDRKEKIVWNLHGKPDAKVIYMRYIEIKEISQEFAQVTVRIKSKQSLTTYKGNTPKTTEPQEIEDILVFEYPLSKTNGTWRICGKLN